MTLIQLECFLRVAAESSFTKAADALFISRQVVSAHVKALETELGFPLFFRENKRLTLTDQGGLLYQHLSVLEGPFRTALQEASAHSPRTELRLGLYETSQGWDERLYTFMENRPNCRLFVDALPLTELAQGLIDERFDFILSLYNDLPHTASTNFAVERLRPVQLVAAVSRSHPLAERSSLDFVDLAEEPLFHVNTDYCAAALPNVLGHFKSVGHQPREILTFPNYRGLALSLSAGRGVCITFDIFLAGTGEHLKLFPLRQMGGIPMEQLAMAYRRDKPLAQELADFVRDVVV